MIELARAAKMKAQDSLKSKPSTRPSNQALSGQEEDLSPRGILKDLFSPKFDATPPIAPPTDTSGRAGIEAGMSAHDYIKRSSASDLFWKAAAARVMAEPINPGLMGLIEQHYPDLAKMIHTDPTGRRVGWGALGALLGGAAGGLPGAAIGGGKWMFTPEFEKAIKKVPIAGPAYEWAERVPGRALSWAGGKARAGAQAAGEFAGRRLWPELMSPDRFGKLQATTAPPSTAPFMERAGHAASRGVQNLFGPMPWPKLPHGVDENWLTNMVFAGKGTPGLHAQITKTPGLMTLYNMASEGAGELGRARRILSGTEKFRPQS
jgi:hypothetical protein